MTYKSRPYKEPKETVGTVAELFAGVGGFRIGLARAGWKTVFSNQWEPTTKTQHASEVYVARFGPEGHSNEDISKVKKIPAKFDLLVGGFPCQDYSVAKSANTATGLAGKKGVLWWEILRLVIKSKPKYIFLENVDRLLKSPTSQRGRDFAIMLTTLGSAGYVVEWRVVNAAEYGFPQRRIRVYIVATRQSLLPRKLNAEEHIVKSGVFARSFPINVHSGDISTIFIDSDAEAISENFNNGARKSPFENAGVFFGGAAYTARVTSKSRTKPTTLGDILVADTEVPDEYWVAKARVSEWKYLKGAKSLARVHKESGFEYTYSEGAMAFPDSVTKASRTILTGEGGSTPSRFKHIIQTESGLRRLLPIELERLCGFPDGWTAPTAAKPFTDGRRAFFMGNALVVGAVERVGKVLAEDLSRKA